MLADGTDYEELGGAHFDDRKREAVQKRLIRRLEALGLEVTVNPVAASSTDAGVVFAEEWHTVAPIALILAHFLS